MNILIVYATTEGQTRKISRFAEDRLGEAGHSVTLAAAEEAIDISPTAFDASILAGSVHTGKFQIPLLLYAARHSTALNAMPTLFISVSLAAAGKDEAELADLDRIVSDLSQSTGWEPGQVAQVAGAFRFEEYDFFKYWAMRWIERQKDPEIKPGTDREYTDWEALAETVDTWVSSHL